jgi:hypothetical protein
LDDFKEAVALYEDFDAKYVAYSRRCRVALGVDTEVARQIAHDETCRMIGLALDEFGQKLFLMDNVNKEVFRQLLTSKGISVILGAQTGSIPFLSWTYQDMRVAVSFLLPLICLINLMVRRDGQNYGLGSLFNSIKYVPVRVKR